MAMQLLKQGRRAWPVIAGVLLPASAGAASEEFLEAEVTVLRSFAGDEGAGNFGWAVSGLRDVDGDGAREAMTGAPFNAAGGENAGRAYVYSGASGAPLFTWTGEPNDALGYALADAGDVDGDGASDIIVGAPGFAGPGRAYLYSGADGSQIHLFVGTGEAGSFGSAVASAGDLDGDGRADLLVGAETDPTAGMNAGRVVAFSGADFEPLWVREGDAVNGFLGSGAAPLGDVDGDGTPDVVVGARGAGQAAKGSVYVLSGTDGADLYAPREADETGGNLGHFFVAGVGDLDGDGASEVYGGDYADSEHGMASGKAYVWSGKTGALLYQFVGELAGDGLGCGRGAGDADGDGTPDLAIGAYGSDPNGVKGGGRVVIFSGATGAEIRRISGAVEQLQVGFDVVGVGDVDADGRDDLLLSGAFLDRMFIISGATDERPEDTTGAPATDSDAASDAGSASDTGAPADTGASSDAQSTGDAGVTEGDAGTSGAPAGTSTGAPASGGGEEPDGGCGCRSAGASGWLLAPLALLYRRRRAGAP